LEKKKKKDSEREKDICSVVLEHIKFGKRKISMIL